MTAKSDLNMWVVVAEQSSARIFSVDRPDGDLHEVDRLEHPLAERKNREIVTDRPGRTFDSAGQHRHAMDPQHTPAESEAIRFAKRVADHLEQARVAHRFDALLLVAGPEFLGRLRQELTPSLGDLVRAEITKNLGQFNAAEIREHLPERL